MCSLLWTLTCCQTSVEERLLWQQSSSFHQPCSCLTTLCTKVYRMRTNVYGMFVNKCLWDVCKQMFMSKSFPFFTAIKFDFLNFFFSLSLHGSGIHCFRVCLLQSDLSVGLSVAVLLRCTFLEGSLLQTTPCFMCCVSCCATSHSDKSCQVLPSVIRALSALRPAPAGSLKQARYRLSSLGSLCL